MLLFYLYPVLSNRARYSHFALFILYKKKQGFEIFFLSLLCSTWGHYCILPVFFVPASFVKECTDLLMSKSKSLLIVFVAYHHNANVNPRGYNEFISRFCVLGSMKTRTQSAVSYKIRKKCKFRETVGFA